MLPQLHTSGCTLCFVKEQERAPEKPERSRITFCFLLLRKPFQRPPTQVWFALQRGSCKEHRRHCFPQQLSLNKALSPCFQRQSLSEKMLNNWAKLYQLGGVYTDCSQNDPERGSRVTWHQRVETLRLCQCLHPNERKLLVARRSPSILGGS